MSGKAFPAFGSGLLQETNTLESRLILFAVCLRKGFLSGKASISLAFVLPSE